MLGQYSKLAAVMLDVCILKELELHGRELLLKGKCVGKESSS